MSPRQTNHRRMERHPFQIRLSPDERKSLESRAEAEGVDKATVIRQALAAYYAVPPVGSAAGREEDAIDAS